MEEKLKTEQKLLRQQQNVQMKKALFNKNISKIKNLLENIFGESDNFKIYYVIIKKYITNDDKINNIHNLDSNLTTINKILDNLETIEHEYITSDSLKRELYSIYDLLPDILSLLDNINNIKTTITDLDVTYIKENDKREKISQKSIDEGAIHDTVLSIVKDIIKKKTSEKSEIEQDIKYINDIISLFIPEINNPFDTNSNRTSEEKQILLSTLNQNIKKKVKDGHRNLILQVVKKDKDKPGENKSFSNLTVLQFNYYETLTSLEYLVEKKEKEKIEIDKLIGDETKLLQEQKKEYLDKEKNAVLNKFENTVTNLNEYINTLKTQIIRITKMIADLKENIEKEKPTTSTRSTKAGVSFNNFSPVLRTPLNPSASVLHTKLQDKHSTPSSQSSPTLDSDIIEVIKKTIESALFEKQIVEPKAKVTEKALKELKLSIKEEIIKSLKLILDECKLKELIENANQSDQSESIAIKDLKKKMNSIVENNEININNIVEIIKLIEGSTTYNETETKLKKDLLYLLLEAFTSQESSSEKVESGGKKKRTKHRIKVKSIYSKNNKLLSKSKSKSKNSMYLKYKSKKKK